MNEYVNFLSRYRGAKVFPMPYTGNSGDDLIVAGTLRVLTDCGAKIVHGGKNADLILFPGGNPTMWGFLEDWRNVWREFPDVPFAVGPATFRLSHAGWPEAIRREGPNVVGLFARDPLSFEVLRSLNLGERIRIALVHDAALFLKDSEFLQAFRDAAEEDYDLFSFRRDHEGQYPFSQVLGGALGKRLPVVLRIGAQRFFSQQVIKTRVREAQQLNPGFPAKVMDTARLRFFPYLHLLNRARHIHTDRLHVMLLGAMLGKKVFAYRTSHSKLEMVYEHSLKSWAEVDFIG